MELHQNFDPDGLVRQALLDTGAAVDTPLSNMDALHTLCADFAEHGPRFNFFGRKRAETLIAASLAKAVRLRQFQQRHPDIDDVEIARPIIIVAPFRTGTTFLFRLLACDPSFRWPRTWEVAQAAPAEPLYRNDSRYFCEDPRIPLVSRGLKFMHKQNPDLQAIHETGANLPEECFGLLETTLHSHSFVFYGPVSNYLDWLGTRDEDEWQSVYASYRDQLKLLQWWYPGDRWLLKSPVHLWNLRALCHALPDAQIIQLHRDPQACVASFCSLLSEHYSVATRETDYEAVGRLVMRYTATALERAVEARTNLAATRFFDLHCDDLRTDPMGCVQRIYAWAGRALTPHTQQLMRDHLSTHQGGNQHCYDAGRFGLNASGIAACFAPYDAFCRTAH